MSKEDNVAALEGLQVVSAQDENASVQPDPTLEANSTGESGKSATKVQRLTELVAPSGKTLDEAEKQVLGAPIFVDFKPDDRRNPENFTNARKWAITIHSCYATMIAAMAGSAYNIGFDSMIPELNCTEFQATLGLSLYALGFGVVPLFSSSFSEEFGRQPVYMVSAIGFFLMYVMIAEGHNIQTVLVARFLQGAFGSTWATMVAGTLADIWRPPERGFPMSIFAAAALGGSGVGPLISGWVEMNPTLQWKWIQWVQMINCACYMILIPLIMRETRGSILLSRLAKKLRKETGDSRYRARSEVDRAPLRTLIYISCTRPVRLLLTEPVVTSFSIWIGFAWGLLFCLIESVAGVFRDLHDFNIGQIGSIFTTMIIGSIIGFFTNYIQEYLYAKHFPKRGPEARLYLACFAAIALPASMFIYAWTSYPNITWVAQAVGVTFFIWTAFIMYVCVFTYLADCYGPFASSALAGQSLCRQLAGMAFPMFTQQMFSKVGYRWGNTIFGFIGTAMIPIPFILFFFGPSIRRRSKFSRMVLEGRSSA